MHEISLCESALQVISDQAKSDGFSKVKRVWLELGSLSCAEPEAMRFAFDSVAKGTLAEGAELIIEQVPAEGRCHQCGRTVPVSHYAELCPGCGIVRLDTSGGDQLRIRELEVI